MLVLLERKAKTMAKVPKAPLLFVATLSVQALAFIAPTTLALLERKAKTMAKVP